MAEHDHFELVLQFEEAFSEQPARAWDFWNRLSDGQRTNELLFDLLLIELDHANWSCEQIGPSLELLRSISGDDTLGCRLLGKIYQIRVESRERPHIDDFAGFITTSLQDSLKMPSDPCGLGYRLAERYLVKQRLGNGGFGVVFLAEDEQDGGVVAIKSPVRINNRFVDFASAALEGEVSAAQAIEYCGCPAGYKLIKDEQGHPFLVMQYIDGPSLADMIAQGPLEPVRAAMIMAEVCDILSHAHRKRVLHRDVKPANILLDASGKVYLTDFGLAIFEDRAQLQRDETIEGTLDLMSPDAILGFSREADGRRDIWAVGKTLFQALVGQFDSKGNEREDYRPAAIVAAKMTMAAIPPTVPEPIKSVCRTCLEADPRNRFDTADEVAQALRLAVTGHVPKRQSKPGLHAWRLGTLLGDFQRYHDDFNCTTASIVGDADSQTIAFASFILFGLEEVLSSLQR